MAADAAREIIRLRDVTAGYDGRAVLRHVTLDVRAGEFVGLLGPSGSGKTTLLRVLLGTVPLAGGSATIDGLPPGGGRPSIGYVPQMEAIDWNFPVTVEEVVLLGRAMHSGPWPWPRQQDREQMLRLLDRLGIAGYRRQHIRNLSGGQQRRVFLARALIRNPRLLLLDEPTSNVDIRTRDDILHLLDELSHEGVAVVLTTHELNAVAAHLPRVVCLNGEIVADGPPTEVFTPQVLERTYGGEVLVFQQDGLPFVADRPHAIAGSGDRTADIPRAAGPGAAG